MLALALTGFGSTAQAAVILEIDISDSTAVRFTSTAAFSQITVDQSSFDHGVTLLDFFTGNTLAIDVPVDSGAIEAPTDDGFRQLSYIFAGPFPGGWTLEDLNFYDPYFDFADFTMTFASDTRALAGGATHDLSGMGLLPAPGTIGTLVTGFPGSDEVLVLGQWRIAGGVAVNEPPTMVLLCFGLLGFAALRWRPAA
jgi:hypothetical protein